jgi:hypothetical protein
MKLSYENWEKIERVCTSREMDFILYIGRFQDDKGRILGLSCKSVCKTVGICKTSFYHFLNDLQEKKILDVDYGNEETGWWKAVILNNAYENSDDCRKKPYLNLNHDVFLSKAFHKLTKSEKIVFIRLIRMGSQAEAKLIAQSAKFRGHMAKALAHGIKLSYRAVMDWTGKSLRSARKFIKTLINGGFITCDKKEGSRFYIDCLSGLRVSNNEETDIKLNHLLEYSVVRAHCQVTHEEAKGVRKLIKQFERTKEHGLIAKATLTVLEKFGEFSDSAMRYLNVILNPKKGTETALA